MGTGGMVGATQNLALLYDAQGRYAEAERLDMQALEFCRELPGPEYPAMAACLNNLAAMYEVQGRFSEAAPLYTQAFEIAESSLGPSHPATQTIRRNLEVIRTRRA